VFDTGVTGGIEIETAERVVRWATALVKEMRGDIIGGKEEIGEVRTEVEDIVQGVECETWHGIVDAQGGELRGKGTKKTNNTILFRERAVRDMERIQRLEGLEGPGNALFLHEVIQDCSGQRESF
jgi:hypothetical protein